MGKEGREAGTTAHTAPSSVSPPTRQRLSSQPAAAAASHTPLFEPPEPRVNEGFVRVGESGVGVRARGRAGGRARARFPALACIFYHSRFFFVMVDDENDDVNPEQRSCSSALCLAIFYS